jgi:hypothetical protein
MQLDLGEREAILLAQELGAGAFLTMISKAVKRPSIAVSQ